MLPVLLLILVVYVTSSLIRPKMDTDKIQSLVKESIKYSGINQSAYKDFLVNINMAIEYNENVESSKKFLHRAVNNLDEISLSSVAGDTGVQEEIDVLTIKLLAYFNELHIRNEIQRVKYLKELSNYKLQ
jgi:hypothetical protein